MALILGNNLADTLLRRVEAGPGRSAILRKRQGVWSALTWEEVERRVFRLAQSLAAEGVGPGDRVALLSQNRPEWALADFAVLSLGAVTVPIYPSLTADDVDYILRDSGATFVFIDDSVQRVKMESLLPSHASIRRVVSFDPVPQGTAVEASEAWQRRWVDEGVAPLLSFVDWKRTIAGIARDASATIVYTSGTEGLPKGAVLSHGNFLDVMASAAAAVRIGEQDLTLLFLPMAHIIGRLEEMLSLGVGWTNAYPERPGKLMENLAEIRPTILFGVPRVYEKIRDGVLGALKDSGRDHPRRWREWVVGAGLKYGLALRARQDSQRLVRVQWRLLDRFLLRRIRAQFGGRLRFAISGGAPLPPEVGEFFQGCGIAILEGYGLTETTGPVCLNLPPAPEFGTVGKSMPGVELRIAADGEILLRGPMLFRGYFETASGHARAATDAEGWFATGDIGRIDPRGNLCITDRKKDLIITSGGKNIAPARVEAVFRTEPLVSHVLIAGDRRNYLTALFTLNVEQARSFCEKQGIVFVSLPDLVVDPVFQREFARIVEDLNGRLAPYERVRRFQILSRDFSIEAGELTPSHKVKRTFCVRKYAHLIEEMYR
jgi:long-chain acyl-CoA synthetase